MNSRRVYSNSLVSNVCVSLVISKKHILDESYQLGFFPLFANNFTTTNVVLLEEIYYLKQSTYLQPTC